MKTAMQELIEWIESTQFPKEGSGNYIYEKAKKLLKIEKEQIADAFNKGKDSDYIHYEDWYKQNYNQNK
jgi:hypothetical protein